MKKRILLISSVIAFAVIIAVLILFLIPSPRGTALKFMSELKKEDFTEMSKISTISVSDLIDDLSSINVYSYSIKSVSDATQEKYRITDTNTFTDSNSIAIFKYRNERTKEEHPTYVVIEETETSFILESPDEFINTYSAIADVEYSTITGEQKRSSVYIKLAQKELNSSNYLVTEVSGFID